MTVIDYEPTTYILGILFLIGVFPNLDKFYILWHHSSSVKKYDIQTPAYESTRPYSFKL